MPIPKIKMLTSANILLIGGLITLILTYIAARITDQESKDDQKKLKNDLAAQSREYALKVDGYAQNQKANDEVIKDLQRQLIAESREQVGLYKRLAESQEQIANLTKETHLNLTGGDGYCFVNIYPETPDSADIVVISESKYPLHGVEIGVSPWLFIDQFYVDKQFAESYKKTTIFSQSSKFKIGVLPANNSDLLSTRQVGKVPYDSKKTFYYTIDFIASNREWSQVWELSLDSESRLIKSHIIYDTIIEDNTLKRRIIKKFINPKASHSILDYLITESKLNYNSQ